MYEAGECVLVTDVPIPVRCRVIDAETFDAGTRRSQILKLAPLEGPWPFDTTLIRLDYAVKPATLPGGLVTVPRRPGPRIRKRSDPAT
jgi:hypothetical protein